MSKIFKLELNEMIERIPILKNENIRFIIEDFLYDQRLYFQTMIIPKLEKIPNNSIIANDYRWCRELNLPEMQYCVCCYYRKKDGDCMICPDIIESNMHQFKLVNFNQIDINKRFDENTTFEYFKNRYWT